MISSAKHLGHGYNSIFVFTSNLQRNAKTLHQLSYISVSTSSIYPDSYFRISVFVVAQIGVPFVCIGFSA